MSARGYNVNTKLKYEMEKYYIKINRYLQFVVRFYLSAPHVYLYFLFPWFRMFQSSCHTPLQAGSYCRFLNIFPAGTRV